MGRKYESLFEEYDDLNNYDNGSSKKITVLKSDKTINRKMNTIVVVSFVFIFIFIVVLTFFNHRSFLVNGEKVFNNQEKQNNIDSLSNTQKKVMGLMKEKSIKNTDIILNENKNNKMLEYKEYEKLRNLQKEKMGVTLSFKEKKYNSINDIKDNILYNDNVLPSKFDLCDKIIPKNKGNYNLDFAFAALNSLETNYYLVNKKQLDLSEMHLDYITSDKYLNLRKLHSGGNFSDFEFYTSTFGPVLEKDATYDDYGKKSDFVLNLDSKLHVTKTIDFPYVYQGINESDNDYYLRRKENIEIVKRHLLQYGSLSAIILKLKNDEKYYNDLKKAMYFDGDYSSINNLSFQMVSIVGYDDDYSIDNFDIKPKNKGAFLALSYDGKGYFHISYDDAAVLNNISGVISTSLDDAYDINDIKSQKIKNILKEKLGYSFIDDKYVTDVALSNITNLDLSNLNLNNDDLRDLYIFKYLNSLDISNNNITDISGLEKMTNLSFLDISDNGISSISVLSKLKNLNNLYMANNSVSDISPLGNLDSLYSLDISGNSVTDISCLSKIYSLVASNTKNLKGFDKLNSLEFLEMKNVVNDFSFLNKLLNLKHLDISDNDLSSKKIINDNLYEFDCKRCNLNSLSNLQLNKNISVLDLSDNNLTSLEGIDNYKYINDLNLSNNNNIGNYNLLESIFSYPLKKYDYDNMKSVFESVVVGKGDIDYTLFDIDNNGIYELFVKDDKKLMIYQYYNNSMNKMYEINYDDVNIYSTDYGSAVILWHLNGKYYYGEFSIVDNKFNVISLSNVDDTVLDDISERYSEVNFTNDLSSFDYINAIGNDKSLDVSNNNINDLSVFKNLNVSELNLSGNKNLKNFSDLKNISTLIVSNCGIDNIDEIADLSNLVMLDLSNNNLSSISKLNNLKKLEILSLANNKNLSGYLTNDSLNSLNLTNCGLSDLNNFSLNNIGYLNVSDNYSLSNYLKNLDFGNNYLIIDAYNLNYDYSELADFNLCHNDVCATIYGIDVNYNNSSVNNDNIIMNDNFKYKLLGLEQFDNLKIFNGYLTYRAKSIKILDSSKSVYVRDVNIDNVFINKLILKKVE